ncbi:hypothetical protein C1148_19600 [Clostridium botulinum]|nr:hypothetical protein C1148_19600 [Clostridium botulinum]
MLNIRFGKFNILSILLRAIILGIYLKFLPYIFEKSTFRLRGYNTTIKLIQMSLRRINNESSINKGVLKYERGKTT